MSGQAKLERLSIRHIRSFGEGLERIQFHTPLTLIVGLNGSGKTTIIECLKYACTGDLPPNSKNGAFVHDPALTGEKEVLGQVKLNFRGTDGANLVITRNMSLTVKKTTRSFSTLEAQLLMRKSGERMSISSRVGELNTLLPVYLGVPKAIIDHVIFCHQEESLWPMSEPAALKKKFDAIFEAEKYTNAINNIKTLRKSHADQLKQLEIHEKHAKEDKIRGEKAKKRMTQLSNEIENMREQTQTIESQMQEAGRQSAEAYDKAAEFVAKVEELKSKRTNVATKETLVQDLKSTMRAMDEPDHELRHMSETYEERVGQYQQELDSKTQQWHQLQTQVEKGRKQEGNLKTEHGRLQAAKESHDSQIASRETLVKESARRHNIRGYDQDDLDHDQVVTFMDRIAKLAKDQNSTLERARREAQDQIRDVQARLDSFKEQKTVVTQRRETAKQQIASNDKKVADCRRSVDKVEVDEGRKAAMEASMSDISARLETAKSSAEKTDWSQQIEDARGQINSLESKATALQSELMQAAEQAGAASEVNRLKKVTKEARLRLDTNKGAQSGRITALVGEEWNEDSLEEQYNDAISARILDMREAEQQRDGTSREMEQLGVKLKTLRSDLKRFEAEAAQSSKKVCDVIGKDDPSGYGEYCAELETEREDIAGSAANKKAFQKFWNSIQDVFEKKTACRVCLRSYKPNEDTSKFKKNIADNLAKALNTEVEKNLKEISEEIKQAKTVGPMYERWSRLSTVDLPDIKKEIARLEPKHNALQETLERQDRLVDEKSSDKSDAESLAKTVQSMVQDATLIRKTTQEVEEVSRKQSEGQKLRSPDEIRDDSNATNEELRALRSKLGKLQEEREKTTTEVNRLELELRDGRSKLQTILGQLKEKSTFTAQIAELSSHNEEQRGNMRHYDHELDQLSPKIAQSDAELDDLRRRRDSKERDLREEASMLTNTRDRLELAQKEIQAYLDRNGPAQLASHEKDIKRLREEQDRHESNQRQLTTDLNKLKEQQRNQAELKRQIMENLRYRSHSADLATLRSEISELEKENAESDRDLWETNGRNWGNERNKLSTEQASILGEMKSKDKELARLLDEFETDGKDASRNYKEANVKVQVTRHAIEDLGRYGGALEKAIMKFHTLKMQQINDLIEELWRRTYQGTDVDTIMIKSDVESAKSTSRTTNYRVVMMKQDAEMDMRGRCSAGQKVLACIIIRLALAECFGANCGMIALDEPTTNLDSSNIKALAESLHNIIEHRKAQKNFQLIIITHDEEFLKAVHPSDHTDFFYRVGRKSNQESEILQHSISELSHRG